MSAKTSKITVSLPHMERAYLKTVQSPSNLIAQLLNDRIRREFWTLYIARLAADPDEHRTFDVLVMVEGNELCVSVAHKRFSKAEVGRIVATDFLRTAWTKTPLSEFDQAFIDALAFKSLSPVDFYAMYGSIVRAVLARNCADLSGHFVLDTTVAKSDRRGQLDRCIELQREIGRIRTALHDENKFAEKVELNTRIKELESRLAKAKASL